MKLMTIKELAVLCDVSAGTISKAFSGSYEISEDTRQKIFDIAKQNGCFDSLKVRKFSKKTVGVILPDISRYASTCEKLCDFIYSKGAVPLVLTKDRLSEVTLLGMCVKYKKADGVIIINPSTEHGGDRIVSLNISDGSSHSLSDAIKLLKSGGHTRISLICSSSGKYSSVKFRNILEENGIRSGSNYFAESDGNTELSGYETMEYLFGMPTIPTAVIAETDALARGAEKYIMKRGMKVPKDISVIGLESFSKNADLDAICKTAVRDILKKITTADKKRNKRS